MHVLYSRLASKQAIRNEYLKFRASSGKAVLVCAFRLSTEKGTHD